jgi:hypothetical protein
MSGYMIISVSPIYGGGGICEANDGRGPSTIISPAHHRKRWSPLPVTGVGEEYSGYNQ